MATVRSSYRLLGTVEYQALSQRPPFRLPVEGAFVRYLVLDLSAVLNVTGLGTAAIARNPGTIVPTLDVTLNGNVVLKRGRWVDWIDRGYMYYGKTIPQTRDTTAVNATTVRSRIIIPFEMPLSRDPQDTALWVGPDDRLDLNVTWGDEDSIVNGGTKAFTTNPSIRVTAATVQNNPAPKGYFIENFTEFPNLGTAALADQNLELVASPNKNYHSICMVTENNLAAGSGGRTLADWTVSEFRLRQTINNEQNDVRGPMNGDEMQQTPDIRFATVAGVTTGLYPVYWTPEVDGMRSFAYPTGGLSDLRVILSTTGTPTTEGVVRILENIWKPFPA